MKQVFFAAGQYLGEANRTFTHVQGQAQCPYSEAFFCPVCGEVWGVAAIPGQPFYPNTLPCQRHYTHALAVPGSMIIGRDSELFRSMPLPVLTRELLLHLDYFEKRL